MLYSKFGSMPQIETDGTDGWIEVDYPPSLVPDGYEVVWWSPPGWVVRPVKPDATETTDFVWDQSLEQWIEYSMDGTPLFTMVSLTTQQVNLL